MLAGKVDDYDRAFLQQHLLGCIAGPWWSKADVSVRFARTLGFARTSPQLKELIWSLMRALQQAGVAEVQGRGDTACYRKAKS
ncbi:MAG: hypothetical protein ACREXG_07690 [Polaromonas sp.]